MSFLNSVIFGAEGSYNILGVDVTFEKSNSPRYSFALSTGGSGVLSIFTKSLGYLADNCLNSNVFRFVTQGYAHTFVHEMGHALACSLLTDQKPKVRIFTDLCVGATYIGNIGRLSPKISSIIATSGPMADTAFSGCKLLAATALRSYLSTPIAVTIGAGAVVWMTGELFLAYISASNKDDGDFGKIAEHGSNHLILASTALIGQCALGVLAACKFI
jgi:hypothetical protein